MRYTISTLALTGFLAVGLVCSASAQNDTAAQQTDQSATATTTTHHHHHMDADRDLARMTKRLDLTQDQQSQIKPILQDRDQQLSQLYQDTSTSKADRRAKAKQIRDDANAKITPILNPDQQQKFSSHQTRHHHHHNGEAQPTADQGTSPQ